MFRRLSLHNGTSALGHVACRLLHCDSLLARQVLARVGLELGDLIVEVVLKVLPGHVELAGPAGLQVGRGGGRDLGA